MQVAASKDASNKERGVFSLMKERSNCASRLPVVTALVAASVLFGLQACRCGGSWRRLLRRSRGARCRARGDHGPQGQQEGQGRALWPPEPRGDLLGRRRRAELLRPQQLLQPIPLRRQGQGQDQRHWSSEYILEIEDGGNLSKFVDQFNDNPSPGALTTRKAAVALASKDSTARSGSVCKRPRRTTSPRTP